MFSKLRTIARTAEMCRRWCYRSIPEKGSAQIQCRCAQDIRGRLNHLPIARVKNYSTPAENFGKNLAWFLIGINWEDRKKSIVWSWFFSTPWRWLWVRRGWKYSTDYRQNQMDDPVKIPMAGHIWKLKRFSFLPESAIYEAIRQAKKHIINERGG